MKLSNIFWPPGYYILRDRIPFFLTIIFIYRDKIHDQMKIYLGLYLTAISTMLTVAATGLYLIGADMAWISGIKWSPASPIQWGVFIIVSNNMLRRRGLGYFEAFYVSFIAALGGGWLYECHGWILDPNFMAFFKVNAVKVFFIEFQLFCLPIIWYLIRTRYNFTTSKWLIPSVVFGVLFYAATPWIKTWFPYVVGYYAYRWYIRLPTIGFLFALLSGIKGVKKQ